MSLRPGKTDMLPAASDAPPQKLSRRTRAIVALVAGLSAWLLVLGLILGGFALFF